MQPTGKDFMYGGNNGVGAYIFETSARKPLDVHLDLMNRIGVQAEKQKAEKALQKKAMEDALSKFDMNPDGAWQYDIPSINQDINMLHGDFTKSLKEGISPEGLPEYGAKKRDIEGKVETSKQQQKLWGDSYKALLDDRDATNSVYDWEASKANLEKYPTMSIEERKANPTLLVLKEDDLLDYVDKVFKTIEPETKSKNYATQTQQGVITTEEVTPEDFKKAQIAEMRSNPKMRELALEKMSNLPPAVQQEISNRVAAKAAKGEFVSPEEEYVLSNYDYMTYSQQKRTSSNNPNAGRNFDRELLKKAAEERTTSYALMATGDKNVYTEIPGERYSTYTGEHYLNEEIGTIQLTNLDAAMVAQMNPQDLANIGLTEDDIYALGDKETEVDVKNRVLGIRYDNETGQVSVKSTKSLIDNRQNGTSLWIPISNMDFLFSSTQMNPAFKGSEEEMTDLMIRNLESKGAFNNGVLDPTRVVQSQKKTPKEKGSEITLNVRQNGIRNKQNYINIVEQYNNGEIELTSDEIKAIVESYKGISEGRGGESRVESKGIRGLVSDFNNQTTGGFGDKSEVKSSSDFLNKYKK